MIWVCLILIGALGSVYSYFIYPLLLLAVPARRAVAAGSPPSPARCSLIIAAHNEEARIRSKIEESLELRSLDPELEIIVASDASTDATDAIVGEFASQGVRLVRPPEHHGKEFAQRAAIAAAEGDIIVFTDTGTTIVPASLPRIRSIFEDQAIGAISSTDRFIDNDGHVSGEGLYVRYEMWLRRLESGRGGLVGLSGSFFAARRSVCEIWDADIPSDFAVALNARTLGFRAVSDDDVIGVYRDASSPGREFARKVRTIIRGMSAVARKRNALSLRRYGIFAFQLWSHKVLRWAVPWFALMYLVGASSVALQQGRMLVLLIPPAIVIGFAALGTFVPATRRLAAVNACFFFVQVNAAAMTGAVQFLAGKRVRTWVPTRR